MLVTVLKVTYVKHLYSFHFRGFTNVEGQQGTGEPASYCQYALSAVILCSLVCGGSVGWGWGVLVLNPISAVRTWAENKLGQTPPPRPSESQFGSRERGALVIGLVYFLLVR